MTLYHIDKIPMRFVFLLDVRNDWAGVYLLLWDGRAMVRVKHHRPQEVKERGVASFCGALTMDDKVLDAARELCHAICIVTEFPCAWVSC